MPVAYHAYRLVWSGLDLIFPPTCAGCGKLGFRFCYDCQKSITPLSEPICQICGRPQPQAEICAACQNNPPRFAALRSWAVFDDSIRHSLHSLKYRSNLGMGDWLAEAMMPWVKTLPWRIDLAVPTPLGRKRFEERGYNQVEVISRPLSLAMSWKHSSSALIRSRETRTQIGLSADERRENVRNAFISDSRQVSKKNILIIDDVATTGATLSSCADALFSAGAAGVYAISVARALPHHNLHYV